MSSFTPRGWLHLKHGTAAVLAVLCFVCLFAFPVQAGPLAGTQITNEAYAVYDTEVQASRIAVSNKVTLTVGKVVSFFLTPDATRPAAPGNTLNLPYTLTNTGNTADHFNLTLTDLPGGYNFLNTQIYPDANGDGLADTGSAPISATSLVPSGGNYNFVVVATVPPPAQIGSSDKLRIDATSATDPTKTTTGATPSTPPSIYTINLVSGPILKLQKEASVASVVAGDVISYTLTLRNDGIAPATGSQRIILDNGPAFTALLVRDIIPANTTLVNIGLPLIPGMTPLYHKYSDALHTYTSTPPADLSLVDAVGFAEASLASNTTNYFTFTVRASISGTGEIRNTASVLYLDGTTAVDAKSNSIITTITPTPPVIANYADPGYTLPVNPIGIGKPLYMKATAPGCNQSSTIVETRTVIILGSNGESETLIATETGPNTGTFTIPGIETKQVFNIAEVIKNDKVIEVSNNTTISVQMQGCDVKVINTFTLIDPEGVVFDSRTNSPVPGATVTIYNADAAGVCLATSPAVQVLENGVLKPVPTTQVTGVEGRFSYPLVPPGKYCVKVVPPKGYVFPSVIPNNLLPLGRTIKFTLAPPGRINAGPSYGDAFPANAATGPVVLDIPLDGSDVVGLFLQKTASRSTAEITEFIDYSIRVKNSTPIVLVAPLKVVDTLPAGFAYVRGSARLDGVTVADPSGGVGPRLEFSLPTIAVDQEKLLTYRVSVGPGALQGDGINRAQAFHPYTTSNLATVKVTVLPGVFSDKGYIIGKVFVDCNQSRTVDADEQGIPAVRLYLEDGTSALTDGEGKFSFYGINNRTHVIKVDNTTMPAGSQMINLSNRNAGDAGSRFVDLKAGELHKANFAEGSCTPEILEQVKTRREAAEALGEESDRRLKDKLDADATIRPLADVKAQPASGTLGVGPLPPSSFRPLLPAGSAARTEAAINKPVATVAAWPDLEKTLADVDNSLSFMELKNGDTLPIAQTNIRVKGTEGSTFKLSVNGVEVSNARVGKKSVLADKQLQAWEYIGVGLTPGENKIAVEQIDSFGNARGSQSLTLIAPDKLGKLVIVTQAGVPADGVSAAKITVKLSDASGVPVTARTALTLEASVGRWQVEDLDKVEPGVQVFIEGGQAEFLLQSPQNPGDSLIKVSSGLLTAEGQADFLPDLRPLIGAGVIEGVLNLRKLNSSALVPARAQDNFEQEIRQFAKTSSDGKRDGGARAAFFLKGKVKGEYLLTLGYDSDKDVKERLFRDIQPDEFYPIYGDSSQRGFDAQSTGKFYVRVDKNKSYALYGDYTTQANTDARRLGNYNRSLTGIKEHYENSHVSMNAFVSRDSTRQATQEFRANGTSGPFSINARALENSEKIEVITRDRNQSAIIIKTELKQRFVDYSIEPLSGNILFRGPVASLDANLNPISIRVTYEVDADNGEKFWIGGVDAQVKLTNNIEVGAVYVEDRKPRLDPTKSDNPADTGKATLTGVNATVKLADKTFVNAELAQSENELKGKGKAARVEMKHDGSALQASVYAGRTSTTFDNPGASLSNGRGEAGVKAAYSIDDKTRVRAEALRTEERATGGVREGMQASVERYFDNNIRAEIGVRHAQETTAPAQSSSAGTTPNKVDSVRIKVGGELPYVAGANVYGEYEQDIKDKGRKVAALGGDYQFASRGRVYARHEFISSLSGPYALNSNQRQNTTVFGIDSDYLQDAHLFSEYRIRDAISGGDTEAAIGLRNLWNVTDGLALNTNFERVYALSGKGDNASTAGGIGLEYTGDSGWKATGRLELRDATTSQSALLTAGLANKISRDWTFLEKNALSITRNKASGQLAAGERRLNRYQAGFAYRDSDSDIFNGLVRFEQRLEEDNTVVGIAKKQSATIISANGNIQPSKSLIISPRFASKWTVDKSNGLNSKSRAHLLGARVTYDLTNRLDLGFTASNLFSRNFKNGQYGLGAEMGYLLTGNLWLSGGYNFFGYRDNDLAGTDYTNRGAFLRLRFKFDEDLLRGSDATVNSTLTPSVGGN